MLNRNDFHVGTILSFCFGVVAILIFEFISKSTFSAVTAGQFGDTLNPIITIAAIVSGYRSWITAIEANRAQHGSNLLISS